MNKKKFFGIMALLVVMGLTLFLTLITFSSQTKEVEAIGAPGIFCGCPVGESNTCQVSQMGYCTGLCYSGNPPYPIGSCEGGRLPGN